MCSSFIVNDKCMHFNYCRKRGVELKVVRRIDYDTELIDWADAVFTAGGDGTFLNAASKIKGRSIPVIGVNTDPLRYIDKFEFV